MRSNSHTFVSNRTQNVASNSIHRQKLQLELDKFDVLLDEPQLLKACNMWQLRVAGVATHTQRFAELSETFEHCSKGRMSDF